MALFVPSGGQSSGVGEASRRRLTCDRGGSQWAERRRGRVLLAASSGKGFGKPEQASQKTAWEKEYKDYVKRNGKDLCAMCYDGYRQLGRGAVLANYTDAGDVKAESDVDRHESMASAYVPLGKLKVSDDPMQQASLRQIIDRIRSYDPEKQFVVVFESHGLMGADIVTPNMPPREVWNQTRDDKGETKPRKNFWIP